MTSRETFGDRTRTHGMTDTRLYRTWCGIKSRCTNANYKHYDRYGGRGISICNEWFNSFETFRDWAYSNGYDDALSGREQSLDRIDVDGNYCPENCRWISMKQQARNRGDTVYIETESGKIPAREFAEQNKITDYVFLFRKIKKGKSANEILTDWRIMNGETGSFMSVEQASDFYEVSAQSIRDWIRDGRLQAEKHGAKWYIPYDQVVKRRTDRDKNMRFLPTKNK